MESLSLNSTPLTGFADHHVNRKRKSESICARQISRICPSAHLCVLIKSFVHTRKVWLKKHLITYPKNRWRKNLNSLMTSLYSNKAEKSAHEPLTFAIVQKRMQMAQELIAHFNVNTCNDNGLTPLMFAIAEGNVDKVYALIIAGADIEARGGAVLSGCTPLTIAAAKGIAQQVEALIEAGANTEVRDNMGWTPLIHAAAKGQLETLNALIKAKANLEMCDPKGCTPLMLAARYAPLAVVKALIAHGALLEARDKKNNTALMWAIPHNSIDVVQALISAGTNIGILDDADHTLLMYAVAHGKIDVVKMLIDAEVFLEARDKEGSTALMWAINRSGVDMVRTLIEAGADIENPDFEGRTPLMCAVIQEPEKIEIVKLLIQAGAKLEAQDYTGSTALMWAVLQGSFKAAQALIEVGANIQARDDGGYTVLALWMATSEYTQKNKPIERLLTYEAADYQYARQLLGRKFLAHVWGIEGRSQLIDPSNGNVITFKLMGMYRECSMKMLSRYVEHFFEAVNIDHSILKEQQKEICTSLANSFPLVSESYDELMAQVDAGKPIVILGGLHNHGISMVIYKRQDQYELIICNRAEDAGIYTTQYYSLAQGITEEMIKKLRSHHYKDGAAFDRMVNSFKISKVTGFRQKYQKVENCAWASAKGAFYILCRLYMDEHTAKEVYKKFTTFSREKALLDYLDEPSEPDFALLEKIKRKYINNKPKLVLADEAIEKLDGKLK